MSKAVLICIWPERCEKIASGQKTIEIRKTRPKIETPFKVYIYESHGDKGYFEVYHETTIGKVIGEFVCDRIEEFESEFYSDDSVFNAIYRVAEDEDFPDVLTAIASNEDDSKNFWICTQSCLSFDEIKEYVGYDKSEKTFYGWHISDLVIYDKPKELSGFFKYWDYDNEDKRPCESCELYTFDYSENMMICEYDFDGESCPKMKLTRPPQNWCYVEEMI